MNERDNNPLKKIPVLRKFNEDMDADSDEEAQSALEKAVMQYKRNKKEGKDIDLSENPKCTSNEINDNLIPKQSYRTANNCAKEMLYGSSKASSDMQDLVKYFMVPKDSLKYPGKLIKTLHDYEKQGAIPKKEVRNINKSKKTQAKVYNKNASSASQDHDIDFLGVRTPRKYLNNKNKKSNSAGKKLNIPKNGETDINMDINYLKTNENTYSTPFFYLVPQNPSPNFSLPRGSYYVIPKTPDSSTQELIIFHPECSNLELLPNMKARKVDHNLPEKLPKIMNNLGKDVRQRTDSHLNIGPAQVREDFLINNLEVNCGLSKLFDKTVISPRELSKHLNIAQKMEETCQEASTAFTSSAPVEAETERAHLLLGLSDKESNIDTYLHEQDNLEDLISDEFLDQKIQEQYERMIRDLPESNASNLLNKCIEFRGNEEKVTAYIEEIFTKIRLQQRMTDLQYIFPDADPSFLLEKIKNLKDDENAINILTLQLLESQSYPRNSRSTCKVKQKLWLTYVKNFDVKNYLLKVSNPEDFAGASGDHNKADKKLILAFLTSRYPTASEYYLNERFHSNSRNITKTCASLVGFQVIRLSESTFEYENFDENFLKEICYIDHREEIDSHLKTVKEMKEIEALEGAFLACPLCSDEELIVSEAITCPEGDVFCKECIRRYVEIKISDATYKFACPMENCDAFLTLSTLKEILPSTILSIVTEKQQAAEIRVAEVDGLEFCRLCDFAYIPNPDDKIFKCQNYSCLAETCRLCREENHIPLRCEEIERNVDVEARKKIEETMTEKLIRNCPKCKKKFVKIDGCNLIQCVCGVKVCYICNNVIKGHSHFQNSSCPMHSSNEVLHTTAVLQAGMRVKNEILMQNPSVRILHDPTETFQNK